MRALIVVLIGMARSTRAGAPRDLVIEALAPDLAYQSLDMAVLPW